ncbi:hepatitis A virus cellular receptor 1 homolog isoform X2 [Dunckerocampus dactyliophorus]|uniref:hepatitis A virus cellular receptor 1 homolog isoform X2 n=1 Tax=Dunckerocampus dactyliophorus TaxID=161453 RepID=UPI002407636F|nr:hepatitis A virus cellular receptor 1 homolog isoform X2 [Dunckerocampus dactyliophorus]
MLLLRLYAFTCAAVITAGTMETVVGMAGRRVALPCRVEAAKQNGVHVCWGRGEPSLFSCHNMLVNMAGQQVAYKSSYRYSVSSVSLSAVPYLSIFNVRPSDSGYYHCRVQLPGLFNDKTFTILLIVIKPSGNLNAPQTTKRSDVTEGVTQQTGCDITREDTTGPLVARVRSPVQQNNVNNLKMFLGHTLRVAFIIFIPAVILTAAYRIWRSNQKLRTDSSMDQSEKEEEEVYL